MSEIITYDYKIYIYPIYVSYICHICMHTSIYIYWRWSGKNGKVEIVLKNFFKEFAEHWLWLGLVLNVLFHSSAHSLCGNWGAEWFSDLPNLSGGTQGSSSENQAWKNHTRSPII